MGEMTVCSWVTGMGLKRNGWMGIGEAVAGGRHLPIFGSEPGAGSAIAHDPSVLAGAPFRNMAAVSVDTSVDPRSPSTIVGRIPPHDPHLSGNGFKKESNSSKQLSFPTMSTWRRNISI
jgi:hypothetical protein